MATKIARTPPVACADLIRELRRPSAYAHDVREVGFRQTHISLLFFAGERVYKVKKPVDLGFLDFTSLERRRHFCEEEVRLNRRLAPQVYLGVVPITEAPTGLVVDGEGEILEWAVEMVRLPEHRMLASLLEEGVIDNGQMNAMAALLQRFHAAAPTGAGVDEYGSPESIRANVEENFEQLQPFVAHSEASGVVSPAQHAFLRKRALTFLEAHRDLLERRVRAQRIREGHGDLHAGNICLLTDQSSASPGTREEHNTIVAYDCIEFSRRFRCGDVALDLAFLAMDLDLRGYPGFASYLTHRYALLADDLDLALLLDFYKGYRALVRAKVAALSAGQPGAQREDAENAALRHEGMRYVQLALGYELPPVMVLMCGLPACGKSWLAQRLATSLRAVLLQSDVRRKVLCGVTPTTSASAPLNQGLYSPGRKSLTYRSLLGDAVRTLQSGRSVIVDATCSKRAYRAPFLDAAARLDVPCVLVHVKASESTTRARLEARATDASTVSDADWEVFLGQRADFEDPSEVPARSLLELESPAVPEEQISGVLDRLLALV